MNNDVLSDNELIEVRASGLPVTNFTRLIDAIDGAAVDQVILPERDPCMAFSRTLLLISSLASVRKHDSVSRRLMV